MNNTLRFALAITCIIPAIMGLLLYRQIGKRYQPLIYILWLAVVTEITKRISGDYIKVANTRTSVSNLIGNLFILVNLVLYLCFFFNVGVLKSKKQAFGYLTFFLLIEIMDAIIKQTPLLLYDIPAVVSYIFILQLSINGIVQQTFKETVWKKDGLFIFYAINIIYSAFFVLLFCLGCFGIDEKSDPNILIFSIHNYINAACYLITIWIILCLQRMRSYIS